MRGRTTGWSLLASAAVALGGSTGGAHAGTVRFDNGIADVGHFDVSLDDYGAYGRQQGQGADDNFHPPGFNRTANVAYMAGVWLFVTTPGNVRSVVALTVHQKLWDFADNNGDGIAGAHTNLTRTITTPITGDASMATSAFAVADAPSGMRIDVNLAQRLVSDAPPVNTIEQDYVLVNNGSVATELVFYAYAEYDIYFVQSTNQYNDDYVGAGPGLCYVFMHDPGSTVWAATLGDNGSTTPMSSYSASKRGVVPDPLGPALESMNSAAQSVWNSHMTATPGMPVTWRNYVATLGYNVAGENDPSVPGSDLDGTIAIEYRLTLAPGASQTIRLDRSYGTVSRSCPVGPDCGDGIMNAGEQCDTAGVDTPACNGATCMSSACGDGLQNAAAGEACESIGIDSTTCNGGTCQIPGCGDGYFNAAAGEACDEGGDTATCNADCRAAACGDGYVNVAANEQCEDGELCDVATCTYAFTLGGGCAGCGVRGEGNGLLLSGLVGLGLATRRRRRRASR